MCRPGCHQTKAEQRPPRWRGRRTFQKDLGGQIGGGECGKDASGEQVGFTGPRLVLVKVKPNKAGATAGRTSVGAKLVSAGPYAALILRWAPKSALCMDFLS